MKYLVLCLCLLLGGCALLSNQMVYCEPDKLGNCSFKYNNDTFDFDQRCEIMRTCFIEDTSRTNAIGIFIHDSYTGEDSIVYTNYINDDKSWLSPFYI